MSIGDRFKNIRKGLGLNQSELARSLGVNPSIISDIERGDKEPSKKIISALIIKYRINSNWLLTEKGEIFIKSDTHEKSRLEQSLDETIAAHPKFSEIETRLSTIESIIKQKKPVDNADAVRESPLSLYTADPTPAYGEDGEKSEDIPYVFNIAAGPTITMDEDRSETVAVPKRLMRKGERYYAAGIRGGSMTEAGIRDGDMVLIRFTDVPADGAIQVVRHQDKSTLKKLREVEGKGWELHYRDGTGRVIFCDSDDFETLGEFEAILPEGTVPKER